MKPWQKKKKKKRKKPRKNKKESESMADEETARDAERAFERTTNGYTQKLTPELEKKAAFVANLLTIKMNNLRPWYCVKATALTNTTSESIYSDRVKEGYVRVLTMVCAKEDTNAPTTIEIAIERGGQTIVLTRQAPGAADISVDYSGQAMLIPGDRVKVTSYGATSGDKMDINCSGYEIKS